MTASTSTVTELLTEHFGYAPVSLIDDIINSINIIAERALNSVEQALSNVPPSKIGFKAPRKAKASDAPDPAEQAKNEIEAGTHQLETLLCASIDRDFDKFEIYVLRNPFSVEPASVRQWIRLGHYEGLNFSSLNIEEANGADGASTEGGDKPTLASIRQLRKRLRESMRLNALLHAEHERNARLLADLRGLVGVRDDKVKDENHPADEESTQGPLAFLRNGVTRLKDAGADTPLSTTTAFTLSQLQALRALSTSLQTVAPHLQPIDGAQEEDDASSASKSWRRERLEYVESATRRHLENVQGLELGTNGEVRDGDWQADGRHLGQGEVEGLEKVVSMLGGEPGAPSLREDQDDMDES